MHQRKAKIFARPRRFVDARMTCEQEFGVSKGQGNYWALCPSKFERAEGGVELMYVQEVQEEWDLSRCMWWGLTEGEIQFGPRFRGAVRALCL